MAFFGLVIYQQFGTNPISDSDRFLFFFFPGTFAANVRNLDFLAMHHGFGFTQWIGFVGKIFTGNHGFYHEIYWGFPVNFPLNQSIDSPIGSWCVLLPSQLCNELMPISYLPKPPKINGRFSRIQLMEVRSYHMFGHILW